MARIEEWVLDLKPPAYPADRIDAALAEQGARTIRPSAPAAMSSAPRRIGQVTPLAEMATDRRAGGIVHAPSSRRA